MSTIVEPGDDELWEIRHRNADEAEEHRLMSAQQELAAALMDACRQACRGNGIPFDWAVHRLREAATQPLDGPSEPTYFDEVRRALTATTKTAIFERDDYRCLGCGVERWLQVDHVIPVSAGGSNAPRNLQTLCRDCNRAKGARL